MKKEIKIEIILTVSLIVIFTVSMIVGHINYKSTHEKAINFKKVEEIQE